MLGDDSFEAVLARGLQHLFARAGKSLGDAQYGRGVTTASSSSPAFDEVHLAQIVAVQIQQVEGERLPGSRRTRCAIAFGSCTWIRG